MTRDEALEAVKAQGFVFPVREPMGDWTKEGTVDENKDLTRLPSVVAGKSYFIVGIDASNLVQKDAEGKVLRETVSVTFNLIETVDGIPSQTSKSFLNRNLFAANKNGVKGSIAAMKAALLNKILTFSKIERTEKLDQFGNNIIEIDYSIQ